MATHRVDGHWVLRLEGCPEVTTDELTLGEVEIAEKVCGVPYVLLNPHASAKEAKALLTLLLMRAGRTEDEALAAATDLPLRVIAEAFTYVLPERPRALAVAGEAGPPS